MTIVAGHARWHQVNNFGTPKSGFCVTSSAMNGIRPNQHGPVQFNLLALSRLSDAKIATGNSVSQTSKR